MRRTMRGPDYVGIFSRLLKISDAQHSMNILTYAQPMLKPIFDAYLDSEAFDLELASRPQTSPWRIQVEM